MNALSTVVPKLLKERANASCANDVKMASLKAIPLPSGSKGVTTRSQFSGKQWLTEAER